MKSIVARVLCRKSFAAALLVFATAAEAGWRELLPIYGGPVHRLVADAGGTLYAATPGGVFKSADDGATWANANGDLPEPGSGALAADPATPGKIYLWTPPGLYRTADGGATWERLPLDLPAGVDVREIAVAPTDPDSIFVSTWGSYVHRSLDGGATWAQSSSGLYGGWGGPSYTVAMAVDPTEPTRVYTSTWRGQLFRSDDAAATWFPIGGGGTWANGQVTISPSDPQVLYTTHDEVWFGRGTILKSTNWGWTWSSTARPAGSSDARRLAVDPADPQTLYVTTSLGVHRSTDGGGSWTLVFAPPAGHPTMDPVIVDPDNPSRLFAGSDNSGFYRSLDAGASWTRHDQGIAATDFTGLEICRDAPAVAYAAVRSVGYLKTTDGGDTWAPVGTAQGLQHHSQGGLGVHPENPEVMITSTWHDGTGRIWRTDDGGDTFVATASGYNSSWFHFNPHQPDDVHVAIADWQGGFLRSTDGGGSWSVPYWWYIYPRSFSFHPDFPNVVFGLGNQYTGAPILTLHVVWSNNSGSSWTGLSFGQGNWNDLAVDGNDPETLYVAGRMPSEGTRGIYKFRVTYSGGGVAVIHRVPGTFNDGLTSTDVVRLVHDPVNAELYAATPAGVFRSGDQGASWELLNGLPHVPTTAMAITPDGSRLLVGTRGGIWEHAALEPPVARCADLEVAAGVACSAEASIDDGSYDPDGDQLSLVQDPPSPYSLGETGVELTVTDADDLTDSCTATVTVVDGAPPAIDCHVPQTITPRDAPIAFTATAADNCGAELTITGYDCWAINGAGRRIDKTDSCVVVIDGATVTIEDSGGVGDHIEWTAVATDAGSNVSEVLCGPIEVVRPGRGPR